MCAQRHPDRSDDDSIAGAVRDGLVEEGKTWLRWAVAGAIVGAVVLGGLGAYLAGVKGLGIGALAGAVVGGVGAGLFYLQV